MREFLTQAVQDFTALDMVGLALLFISWLLYPTLARAFLKHDLTEEIAPYRRLWMAEMLNRSDRITDVSLARGLFTSVTFFASTTILLISGLIGVLSSASSIHGGLQNLEFAAATSQLVFEVKVGALLLIFIYAFFKFSWSMRLHAYSTILIGAAPQPDKSDTDRAREITDKAARLSMLASNHYFDGLRGYYFGLATLSWFAGPGLFVAAILFTVAVLIRREHYSKALGILRA